VKCIHRPWQLVTIVSEESSSSEISDLDVTFFVQEYVLWFEVPVNYSTSVEVLQSQDDLGGVKLGGVLVKRPHLPDVVQQLTSLRKTESEIFQSAASQGEQFWNSGRNKAKQLVP
jgi:hypothetical protein